MSSREKSFDYIEFGFGLFRSVAYETSRSAVVDFAQARSFYFQNAVYNLLCGSQGFLECKYLEYVSAKEAY